MAAPGLAPGVMLLGPYRDSGLNDPPYLIARSGTVLQVSHLLHAVAAALDGKRPYDEIAAIASAELGRNLSGDDVRYLLDHKLVPAGVVAAAGDNPAPRQAPPQPAPDRRLLALRFRRAVVPPAAVDEAARRVGWLFRPAAIAGILIIVVAFDAWLFGVHGVAGALAEVIRQPGLLPFLLVLTLLSSAFHELGHASGCRYSGGRPGAMGAGIYLLWPVLFTNVTDAYRLDRAGRLRSDLGGIYFNAVFVVMLAGSYALTGYEPLLAAVVVEHFLILDQLMPWVRFDGYYVVSDLTGVPDILNRIRPALRSVLPGRRADPQVTALRPRARRLLFAYLASLMVFVAFALATTVREGPRLLTTGWDSLPGYLDALRAAVGMWDLPMGVLVVLQIGLLFVPLVGFGIMLGFVAHRAVIVGSRRWFPGRRRAYS